MASTNKTNATSALDALEMSPYSEIKISGPLDEKNVITEASSTNGMSSTNEASSTNDISTNEASVTSTETTATSDNPGIRTSTADVFEQVMGDFPEATAPRAEMDLTDEDVSPIAQFAVNKEYVTTFIHRESESMDFIDDQEDLEEEATVMQKSMDESEMSMDSVIPSDVKENTEKDITDDIKEIIDESQGTAEDHVENTNDVTEVAGDLDDTPPNLSEYMVIPQGLPFPADPDSTAADELKEPEQETKPVTEHENEPKQEEEESEAGGEYVEFIASPIPMSRLAHQAPKPAALFSPTDDKFLDEDVEDQVVPDELEPIEDIAEEELVEDTTDDIVTEEASSVVRSEADDAPEMVIPAPGEFKEDLTNIPHTESVLPVQSVEEDKDDVKGVDAVQEVVEREIEHGENEVVMTYETTVRMAQQEKGDVIHVDACADDVDDIKGRDETPMDISPTEEGAKLIGNGHIKSQREEAVTDFTTADTSPKEEVHPFEVDTPEGEELPKIVEPDPLEEEVVRSPKPKAVTFDLPEVDCERHDITPEDVSIDVSVDVSIDVSVDDDTTSMTSMSKEEDSYSLEPDPYGIQEEDEEEAELDDETFDRIAQQNSGWPEGPKRLEDDPVLEETEEELQQELLEAEKRNKELIDKARKEELEREERETLEAEEQKRFEAEELQRKLNAAEQRQRELEETEALKRLEQQRLVAKEQERISAEKELEEKARRRELEEAEREAEILRREIEYEEELARKQEELFEERRRAEHQMQETEKLREMAEETVEEAMEEATEIIRRKSSHEDIEKVNHEDIKDTTYQGDMDSTAQEDIKDSKCDQVPSPPLTYRQDPLGSPCSQSYHEQPIEMLTDPEGFARMQEILKTDELYAEALSIHDEILSIENAVFSLGKQSRNSEVVSSLYLIVVVPY